MITKQDFFTFKRFPKEVVQAVSTQTFGSMKDAKGFYKNNIANFANAVGIPTSLLFFPKQTHSPVIKEVISSSNLDLDSADGLISSKKNIFLGVVTADCVPVIFYDPKKKIVAAVHAGYRGLLSGILKNTLQKFKYLGSSVEDIIIGIGPSIGVCCYNVGIDRINLFTATFPLFKGIYKKQGKDYYLNMESVAKQVLTSLGIVKKNIEVSGICTKCNMDKFYSYRGMKREDFGEFATVIGMV